MIQNDFQFVERQSRRVEQIVQTDNPDRFKMLGEMFADFAIKTKIASTRPKLQERIDEYRGRFDIWCQFVSLPVGQEDAVWETLCPEKKSRGGKKEG